MSHINRLHLGILSWPDNSSSAANFFFLLRGDHLLWSLLICFHSVLHHPSLVFTSCLFPFCISLSVHFTVAHFWLTFLHSLLAPAPSSHPQLCVVQGLRSLHPDGIRSPLPWQLAAFSSPCILDIFCPPSALPVFSQGSWVVSGVSSKLTSCLCFGPALLTRPPWHWVSNESAAGASGSCWVWPKSHWLWKQLETREDLISAPRIWPRVWCNV